MMLRRLSLWLALTGIAGMATGVSARLHQAETQSPRNTCPAGACHATDHAKPESTPHDGVPPARHNAQDCALCFLLHAGTLAPDLPAAHTISIGATPTQFLLVFVEKPRDGRRYEPLQQRAPPCC